MDKDNFNYYLSTDDGNFSVSMEQGKLIIDGCEYEYDKENPAYAFAREIAKLRGLI